MPHVVLILPSASYRASDFVLGADELGAGVTVASEVQPPLPGGAGSSFVQIDCTDVEGSAARIVAHADQVSIDAIVAAGQSPVNPTWIINEHNPVEHLLSLQDASGYFK